MAEERGRSAFLKRLPLLALVAGGALLWRAPFFAQDRTLRFELPADLTPDSVELQLWQDQTLLRREQRMLHGVRAQSVEWQIGLREGDYRLESWWRRSAQAPLEHASRTLHVEGREPLVVPLVPR